MKASAKVAAAALVLGSSALLFFGACVKHSHQKPYIFPDMGPTNAALHRQQVEQLERRIADGQLPQIQPAEITYDIEPSSVPHSDGTGLVGRPVETFDVLISWWSTGFSPEGQARDLRIVVQNALWKPLHGVVFEIGGTSYCNQVNDLRQVSILFAEPLPVNASAFLDLLLVPAVSPYWSPRRGECVRLVNSCEMLAGRMTCGKIVDAWIER